MEGDALTTHSENLGTHDAILPSSLFHVRVTPSASHTFKVGSKHCPASLTAYQGPAELSLFTFIFVGTHR